MLGAVVATICYLPGAIKVAKTNDTRSISRAMFILTSCGCLLWVGIGILNIAAFWEPSKPDTLAAGLGTIISNIGLLSCGMVIFIYKFRNINHAKKLGLTEDKYYELIGSKKNWKTLYKKELKKKNSAK